MKLLKPYFWDSKNLIFIPLCLLLYPVSLMGQLLILLKKVLNKSYTRKQDCPTVYEINGAIYIINTVSLYKRDTLIFDKTRKYVMDKRSSIDIDDLLDFKFAEFILDN